MTDELRLTDRHREVLLLRSRGLSNKQIAATMERSEATVDNWIKDMLRANPGHNGYTLLAEFVREQCREGVWE